MVCLDRDRGYWDKVYCIGERERHADIAGSVRTVASTVAADSRPTDPLFFSC